MIREDMHVHSTFSDGADSAEKNVQAALDRGLKRICCVDHVRRATTWLPEMVEEIERLRAKYPIEIYCGIEAKLLDNEGTLDAPDNTDGVDFILAADHRVPYGADCHDPRDVKLAMLLGEITPDDVIREICSATIGAMYQDNRVVIAHMFSVLPKVGLTENDVSETWLERIALAAFDTKTPIEISERWKCPTERSVRSLAEEGVEIWFSTDAHSKEEIGKYNYVNEMRKVLK